MTLHNDVTAMAEWGKRYEKFRIKPLPDHDGLAAIQAPSEPGLATARTMGA
jgi:hypothetical protein